MSLKIYNSVVYPGGRDLFLLEPSLHSGRLELEYLRLLAEQAFEAEFGKAAVEIECGLLGSLAPHHALLLE